MTPRQRLSNEARMFGWWIEERFPDSTPFTPRQTRRFLLFLAIVFVLAALHG